MSVTRNVTVYRCDNNERFAHYGDDETAQVTVSADREGLPDGWVTVEGVADPDPATMPGDRPLTLTFCSLRCVTSRLFSIEKAHREAAEAEASSQDVA